MSDPLKDYQFPESDGGLFVKITEDKPIKLRVLTNDPLIHVDKFSNTRFAFVVWNWTEGKAQILDKGASIARPIQKIHVDEDFGADIQKVDIKITATGSGKETTYDVNVLNAAQDLTQKMVDEAKQINLEEIFKNGTRMSQANNGTKVQQYSGSEDVEIDDVDEDNPVDLTDIPF